MQKHTTHIRLLVLFNAWTVNYCGKFYKNCHCEYTTMPCFHCWHQNQRGILTLWQKLQPHKTQIYKNMSLLFRFQKKGSMFYKFGNEVVRICQNLYRWKVHTNRSKLIMTFKCLVQIGLSWFLISWFKYNSERGTLWQCVSWGVAVWTSIRGTVGAQAFIMLNVYPMLGTGNVW